MQQYSSEQELSLYRRAAELVIEKLNEKEENGADAMSIHGIRHMLAMSVLVAGEELNITVVAPSPGEGDDRDGFD